MAIFRLNGSIRSVVIIDKSLKTTLKSHLKVSSVNHVGSPLQGNLSKILVKEGDTVEANTPLFTIEAMKMESTITAPQQGLIKKVHLSERTLVAQDDLVIEMEFSQ